MSIKIILKVLGFSSLKDLNKDKCKIIKNLDLSNKHLNDLNGCEDIFKYLPNLTHLYLGNNQLAGLDRDIFKHLQNLETLYLSKNQLAGLDKNTFRWSPNLTHLYLYNNQLAGLDRDIFKYLPNLTHLDLSNNQLAGLDRDIFKHLPKLEYLNLGNIQLANLDKDIFKYLPDLKTLYLGNNQLASLDRDIFKYLPKLNYLVLGNNQLKSLKNIPQNIKYFGYDKNPLTEYPRDLKELKEYNRKIALQKIRNVFLKQFVKQIVTNYWYAPQKEVLEKDGTFTLVSRYCIFCKKEFEI